MMETCTRLGAVGLQNIVGLECAVILNVRWKRKRTDNDSRFFNLSNFMNAVSCFDWDGEVWGRSRMAG